MNGDSAVFNVFEEWLLIEQFVREFIVLVDYDGNRHYLPSNSLFQQHENKDEDKYILIEEYDYKRDSLFCDGRFYGHFITKESELRVRHSDDVIAFILDIDSLDEYYKIDPTIQRDINRCKLVRNTVPDFNLYGSLLNVIHITEFELLRQYTNNTHFNNNYIVADKLLIDTLHKVTIDNKALMMLINIMHRTLQ